jgi:hypothetical protein
VRSSVGAIALQLAAGIVPLAIIYRLFDLSVWLSVVLALVVVALIHAPPPLEQ